MSLQSNWIEEIPSDTAEVGQVILKESNPYRLVGDHVNSFLKMSDFAPIYSTLGRGAICPIILALVTVFQFLENIPDRMAALCAVARIDWKYALHVPLTWKGFDYSDLSNFRKRLRENDAERLIFELVLKWVRSLGFLKRYGKQRTDSTHLIGCVERMSRLELMWETLRLALRAIKSAIPEWYAASIPAAFHEAYVERHSDWQLNKEEVKVEMKKAGQDGFWLLDCLEDSAPEDVLSLPEVETLRTVLEQQFERQDGKTIVRKPPIKGKDVLASPHDPEARWSKKRSTQWVGYKLQVTETAEAKDEDGNESDDDDNHDSEGNNQDKKSETVNFITDIDVVASNDVDSEALDEIQERLIKRDLKPEEHNVDQGYVTGPNLANSADRKIELIGPAASVSGDKEVGYRLTDFEIDRSAKKAICPQGCESAHWQESPAPETGDPDRQKIRIYFGVACRTCPARDQCKPGKQGRQVVLSAFSPELSSRRAEQQTEEFKERMKWRAGIEGTIFGLVHSHGARRARYRGMAKVRLQAYFTGAAANLKRLARAIADQAESQVKIESPSLA